MLVKSSIIYTKIVFIAITIVFLISGCSNNMFSGSGKKQTVSPKVSRQSNAVYYDFDDILVPKDMKIDDSSTVVVSTPGHTSGIITLKGRIDKDSLFKFFNNNMQKDNWNIVSQIRSPAATILIFQKVSRWAVITLRNKDYYTYVEIGVAPSVDQTYSNSNSVISAPSSGADSGYGGLKPGAGSGGTDSNIESENLFQ